LQIDGGSNSRFLVATEASFNGRSGDLVALRIRALSWITATVTSDLGGLVADFSMFEASDAIGRGSGARGRGCDQQQAIDRT
jgi:hypothetical protein